MSGASNARNRRRRGCGAGAAEQESWHAATSSRLCRTINRTYRLVVAQVLTTEGVDPRDRLAYWREVICDTFIKLDAPATPSRFRGMVKIDNAGPVQITRLRADPMVARRTRNHVRQLDEEMCLLVVQLRGRTFAGQDGRTASLARGDVATWRRSTASAHTPSTSAAMTSTFSSCSSPGTCSRSGRSFPKRDRSGDRGYLGRRSVAVPIRRQRGPSGGVSRAGDVGTSR